MSKVLILDANHRGALAATRSLGAKSVHVVVAADTPKPLAAASRYCQESFTYPSPYTCPASFIADIQKEVRKRGITTILPITDMSTYFLLKQRDKFPAINIPFGSFERSEMLSNKFLLLQTAQQLRIRIPKTYFIKEPCELSKVYSTLTFPVVVKPYRSRICLHGTWINTSIKYAASLQHLKATVAQYAYFHQCPFLLQEYIRGRGQGLFALYDRARPVVFFAHRRLREKPPSGGVSVLSESIPLDPHICDLGRRLLDQANWHGVAMVEFKVSHDGTPYLMEVNARFWGSLQLAIDAGVDFPWLLYQLAEGKPLDGIPRYAIGVKNRWLLGDCLALGMLLVNRNTGPHGSDAAKCRSLLQFLHLFQRQTRYDVNRWDDLAPFFREVHQYVWRKAYKTHT